MSSNRSNQHNIQVPESYQFRDKQHLVGLLSIGGLYIAVKEVQEALVPIPDRQRTILDLGKGCFVSLRLISKIVWLSKHKLGCGGGNWCEVLFIHKLPITLGSETFP